MEKFVKGNVVILPFPFSDLSATKKRPALIVANLEGNDHILAQITSVARSDKYAISLEAQDFKEGGLPQSSMIRPSKLFTAERSIILYKIGMLNEKKIKEVEDTLVKIFRS